MSVMYLLPLRFMEPVKRLRQCYDGLLLGTDRERMDLCLHLEPRPALKPLFLLDAEEQYRRNRVTLMLAKALGILEVSHDDTRGFDTHWYIERNEDGTPIDQVALKPKLTDCEKVPDESMRKVAAAVQLKLPEYRLNVAKRTELIRRLDGVLAEVYKAQGSKLQDAVFVAYQAALKDALSELKTEE